MTRAAAVLLILAAAAGPGHAADEVAARAILDADRIGESDSVTLTIEVRGASLPQVGEPDLAGLADFTVVSGPNVSTSTSMVWSGGGARVTTVKKHAYVLMPKRRGTLTVPSFTVDVGGKAYRTEAQQIEVVSGSVRPAVPPGPFQQGPFGGTRQGGRRTPSGDVLVEATLDAKEAWVGQQVLLVYKLYTQVELAALPQPRQLPDYNGFWVDEIEVDPRATIRRMVLRGKEYTELTLMKKALFPTKSGDLEIEETAFEILVRADSDDPFDSFFFKPARPIFRRTAPLRLRVKALPDSGRPASFHGAVGRFDMKVESDRKEAQVNDAVALTVKISGDGNLRTIGDPALPDLPDYRRYDPKVEEARRISGDRIEGTRTWSYVLVPLSPGEKTIPPVRFAYFDPAAGTYRELAGPPLAVKVSRGGGAAAGGEAFSARREVVAVGKDIRYIKPASALPEGRPVVLGRGWFWLLAILPLAGNAGLWAHLRRREHLAANAGLLRGRRAGAEARRRLKAARRLLQSADRAAFFESLDRALAGYVADKFDVAAAGLTRERVGEMLAQRRVPEAARRRALDVLERCDFGRFAPSAPSGEENASLLRRAEESLSELERALG